LALEEFPSRSDRPGKHFSMCFSCRLDWAQDYQRTHPERNREGVRRRRARLRHARAEPYQDQEIFLRDKGKCFFCRADVDPSLRYPDPQALVVHHIHPISKGGPDIRKNVAIAHLRCNQATKDTYDPGFNRWAVAPISNILAREVIVERHYLHRGAPISYAYGAFDGDALRGVVIFGSPSSHRISKSACDDFSAVIELNRLWIDDDAPFGIGSWFLSRALISLPPFIVVAYADTAIVDGRYGTHHRGTIYRACSFLYAGVSRPNVEWRIPGKSRNVGKHHSESVRHEVSPKARYWTTTGNRAEKKKLRRMCKWPVLVPA